MPAGSPDLNPVQIVWVMLIKCIYNRIFRPQNVNKLWAATGKSWEELNNEHNYFQN